MTRRSVHAQGFLAAAVLMAPSIAPVAAKAPGVTHCYRGVCHRVRTIEQTRQLIGQTITVETSHYDFPGVDRFNTGTYTSNGERFDARDPARVASSDLPDGTELLVRNPANGRASHVLVNDFGPFHGNRRLDVTRRVAADLGFVRQGVTKLEVTVIAAPREGERRYHRNRPRLPTKGHLGVVPEDDLPWLITSLVTDRSPASRTPPVAVAEATVTPTPTVEALPPAPVVTPVAPPPAASPDQVGIQTADTAPIALPPVDTLPVPAAAVVLDQQEAPATENVPSADAATPIAPIDLAAALPVELPPENTIAVAAAIPAAASDRDDVSSAEITTETSAATDIPVANSPAPSPTDGDAHAAISAAPGLPAAADLATSPVHVRPEEPGPVAVALDHAQAVAAPATGTSAGAGPRTGIVSITAMTTSPTAPLNPLDRRFSGLFLLAIIAGLCATFFAAAKRAMRLAPAFSRSRDEQRSRLELLPRTEVAASRAAQATQLQPASSVSPTPTPLIGPGIPQGTHIAADLTLEGTLRCEGRVSVAGHFKGRLEADELIVLPGGWVDGVILCRKAEVDGDLVGYITARELHVLPRGSVEGEVIAPVISIDIGGRVEGEIRRSPGTKASAPAPEPTRILALPSRR